MKTSFLLGLLGLFGLGALQAQQNTPMRSARNLYELRKSQSTRSNQNTTNNVAYRGVAMVADSCQDALSITCGDVFTAFTTGATVDSFSNNNCGTSVTAPGVWYTVTGNGQRMTAHTCASAGLTNEYDTKVSVYSGSCGNLICVGANDDDCGLLSSVSWNSVVGEEYFILVHGFDNEVGDFRLTLECNCANPDGIQIQGLQASWSNGSVNYQTISGPLGFNPDSTGTWVNTQDSSSHSYNFTQEGAYHAYFRNICGAGDTSAIVGPFILFNYCSPVVSYFEPADDYWTSYVNATDSVGPAAPIMVPANTCWDIDAFASTFFNDDNDAPIQVAVRIYEDNAGLPGATVYAANAASVSSVVTGELFGNTAYYTTVQLASPTQVCGGASGATFWVSLLESSGATNYYIAARSYPANLPVMAWRANSPFCDSIWGLTSDPDCVDYASGMLLDIIPVQPALDLSCPSTVTLSTVTNDSAVVNYALATSASCYPVTVQSGPADGATLAVGSTHTVIFSISNGTATDTCQFTFEVSPNTGLELVQAENIKVFPNPASQVVNLSAAQQPYRLSLISLTGQVLVQHEVPAQQHYELPLQNQVAGFYILHLQFDNGQSQQVKLRVQP